MYSGSSGAAMESSPKIPTVAAIPALRMSMVLSPELPDTGTAVPVLPGYVTTSLPPKVPIDSTVELMVSNGAALPADWE